MVNMYTFGNNLTFIDWFYFQVIFIQIKIFKSNVTAIHTFCIYLYTILQQYLC